MEAIAGIQRRRRKPEVAAARPKANFQIGLFIARCFRHFAEGK